MPELFLKNLEIFGKHIKQHCSPKFADIRDRYLDSLFSFLHCNIYR